MIVSHRLFIVPLCLLFLAECEAGSDKRTNTNQMRNGDSVTAECGDVADTVRKADLSHVDKDNDDFPLHGETLYTGPYLIDSLPAPVRIDNNTLLLFQDTLDGCYFKLEFRKKGLAASVIRSVEKDLPEFLSGGEEENLSVVYGKKLNVWREDILSGEPKYDAEYSVRVGEEDDKHVNCLFYGFSQYACSHGNSYVTCVTYDKRSGRSFDEKMIRMDDALRLMTDETDEEFGNNALRQIHPYLYGDSVVFLFPDWRPTSRETDLPKAILPLEKLLPYLTEEGRRFVER